MPSTGKNKAPRSNRNDKGYEPWFIVKQQRNKRRKAIAKVSRRSNRKHKARLKSRLKRRGK